jgi:hypothetical protein
MAGRPLTRQRKALRNEDGTVIAFPSMPRVADLPKGWRTWEPAEKIAHLLGMSLDDCHEILSWPLAGLDPARLSLRAQMLRVVLLLVKLALDARGGRDHAEVLEQLRQMLSTPAKD